MKMKTSSVRTLRAWMSAGFLAMLSMPAAAVPMAFDFSADVPEFSDPLFAPLNSFLSDGPPGGLGLTEITGTVSWDTDDLDANGDGFLSVPGNAAVTSSLDGFEDDLAGMFVGVENGVLASIGQWQFQIDDDFFFLALINLDSSPEWFVALGTGPQETTTAQNWRLVSLQSVPEPSGIGLLATGLLAIGLAVRRKRFGGQVSRG